MKTKMVTLRLLVLIKGSTEVVEHTVEYSPEYALCYLKGYINATGPYINRWVLINPTPEQETEMRAAAQKNAEDGQKPIYRFTEVDQRQFAEAYGDA